MEKLKRTATCGELRKTDGGKTVVLNGWVHRKREHGGIIFINLRDRYGVTQIVIDETAKSGAREAAEAAKMEYCVAVKGAVRARPCAMVNPEMPTGEIEVVAEDFAVLSKSDVPPFVIDERTNANEDLRLTYRYLDLRSASMQKHIALRCETAYAIREFLTARGFLEIETPTFIKSTPEGARDYLVPSRLYPGSFYALPQSPQLYKQLLMVAGFDRYFQIARCYRDEDARGDRQPEFTQIDIEMSFVSRDDVLAVTEEMLGYVFKKTLSKELPAKFARLSYEEAIDRYGTDKPDLRFALELRDAAFMSELGDFNAFKDALAAGGAVKAIVVPQAAAAYSRKKIEELESAAKVYRARGLAWMKIAQGEGDSLAAEGGIAKFFETKINDVCARLGAQAGDLLLFIADADKKTACSAMGAVRGKLGKDLNLCDPSAFSFVWIIDFPLFEWNEEEGAWEAAHHMFSRPQERYIDSLESDPASVKGDLYDLVLNGYELASGSIRIHEPELQKRVFRIVGYAEEAADARFGFLTKAFAYGAPPHGGIAPGLDRLVMLMCGESSIKEVIAFPKNSFAQNPMDGCPSPAEQKQLDELGIKIIGGAEE